MFKACLECSDRIVGREDKKFCSDACRNAYNNKINRDANNFVRNVNNRLRRNYRILSTLNPGEKSRASRAALAEKGFDFSYFTNIRHTRKGHTYYFLYDQGYMPLENDAYLLVRKQT